MNISTYNSSVKQFLIEDDFRNDKNQHKYILLWSTKFYRLFNKIMRNFGIDEIMKETKYTRRYIIKIVKYFFKYGLYKEDIMRKASQLYRGMDKDFELEAEYNEDGFMSTSLSRLVAEGFAGKMGGNVIVFNTKKLPKGVPFAMIDESIDEYLAEKEILFLPGKITLKKSSTGIKALYEMNPVFNEINKNIGGGGGEGEGGMLPVTVEGIDLKGKHIVWWRAILRRPVEVVGTMEMPKKAEEVDKFFREAVLPHDDKFEVKTNFIPEYMDLKKNIMKDYKNVSIQDRELYKSYMVHMGVYDSKKKQVLTIHYGVFGEMFNEELFDPNRTSEVQETIMKHCAWF